MNEKPDSGHTCDQQDSADGPPAEPGVPGAAPGKVLSPEAVRALLEADERRRNTSPQTLPPEYDGRDGEEPTRYGDWEKKGLAVDF